MYVYPIYIVYVLCTLYMYVYPIYIVYVLCMLYIEHMYCVPYIYSICIVYPIYSIYIVCIHI